MASSVGRVGAGAAGWRVGHGRRRGRLMLLRVCCCCVTGRLVGQAVHARAVVREGVRLGTTVSEKPITSACLWLIFTRATVGGQHCLSFAHCPRADEGARIDFNSGSPNK